MPQPLLSDGEYVESADSRPTVIAALEAELREWKLKYARVDEALRLERGQIEHAVRELRHLTMPFYQLLKAIHGEIDALGVNEVSVFNQGVERHPKWESWKQRMPGKPAEFIELLLIHGSMTIKQFMAAAHCSQDAAYKTVSKLGQAGVTVNSGGKYSLKES